MTSFAEVQYCTYMELVGGWLGGSEFCWCDVWMIYLLDTHTALLLKRRKREPIYNSSIIPCRNWKVETVPIHYFSSKECCNTFCTRAVLFCTFL